MARLPARKIKKSAVKNVVRFAPTKSNNGESILVESIQESKYCLHMEFDSSVVSYFPQPKTFTLSDGINNYTYTPDFEVVYENGDLFYIEVKPTERAKSEHFQSIFDLFEESLEKTGRFNRLIY